MRSMSVTKKVVKKPRGKNVLSGEDSDSDVSYDKGEYATTDEDDKKQPQEVEVEPDTLGSLGMKSFPECIVSREEWGAVKKKKKGLALKHPTPNVIFTYKTGVPKCEEPEECVKVIQELQRRHMSERMSDIAFNFLIGGDYRVYQGRGWDIQPEPKFQYPELRGKRLDVASLGDYTGHEQMPIYLVPRHEWHARTPKDYVLQSHPVKCICVYYRTDMAGCMDDDSCVRRVMDMQRAHMEDDDDIMYNFIIGGNEKVFEGRGWFHRSSNKLPWARYHGNRIDIAYIGNYNGKNDLPFQMLEQQLNLVLFGQEKGYIVKHYTMIEETHKFL